MRTAPADRLGPLERTPEYRQPVLGGPTVPTMRRRPAVRRRTLPTLYDALFEIEAMKKSVAELRPDLPAPDAERLLAKIGVAEAIAVRLLTAAETQARVVAH
jgi:hypothetical protein